MRVDKDNAHFPSEPHFPSKASIWRYFSGYLYRRNVSQLRQDVERVTRRYRETKMGMPQDLIALADEVITQINGVRNLSERICKLVDGLEIPEADKQSFLTKIEGVRKGLIEMEKRIEKELKQGVARHSDDRAKTCLLRFQQSKPFTKEEIEEVDRLIDQRKGDPIQLELKKGRKEIEEAIQKRALLLKKIDKNQIQDLLVKIEKRPRGDLKERDLLALRKYVDLYWALYPPFGVQISDKMPANLSALMSLKTFALLTPNEQIAVRQDAISRLKRIRKGNLGGPKVAIVGGGPGGLARGLTAALAGADWVLLEKRERISPRKNVVKIEDVEALRLLYYFGALDPSFLKEERDGRFSLNLPIGSLEGGLAASLAALTDEKGRVVTEEVVDVRTGETREGVVVTEVLAKGKEPVQADIIVFADGAKSELLKILCAEREVFSTETMQFSINLEACTKTPPKKTPYIPLEGGIQFDFLSYCGRLGKGAYATVVVREDSAALIRSKQKALEAIQDPAERKRAAQALEHWYQECALHYMKWLGYEGKEAALARPFDVVISKATQAAVVEGNALILSSGDAYATPDPAASLGCAMAVKTARQFFGALRSFRDRDHALICAEQNELMDQLYQPFLEASFRERGRYAGQDTRTEIAVVREAESKGGMSKELADGLILAFAKENAGGALTDEDIRFLEEGARLTEHQMEKWKVWLYEKIQCILVPL